MPPFAQSYRLNEDPQSALPKSAIDVLADAAIDNIPALAAAFGLPPTDNDVLELLAQAYQRWGVECPVYLHGDFALAIEDRSAATLMLARDVFGCRSLFFATIGGRLHAASSLDGLVQLLEIRPALNLELAQAFLYGAVTLWTCETIYAGVRRLPPAHRLLVRHGIVGQPELYFRFGEGPAPACRTDSEWIEQYRALLREAVQCRLRGPGPVAIAVSGGLDSSALACIAHDLAERATAPEIRLYSTVFEATPSADERRFYAAVAARCPRFTARSIKADDRWALEEFADEGGFPLAEPELFLTRTHGREIFAAPARDGCRVVLWGEGGDWLTGHNIYGDAQIWWELPWRDRIQEARHYRGKRAISARHLVRPNVPAAVKSLMQRRNARRAESVLEQQFNRSCGLAQAYFEPAIAVASARHLHAILRGAFAVARLSAFSALARHTGIVHRMPFLDRRLVEFSLHLPTHLLSWRGKRRIILREAMRGLMPEEVRTRTTKATFIELERRGVAREVQKIEQLLTSPRLEALGLVSIEQVRFAITAYQNREPAPALNFRHALTLEAWLRVHGY